MILGDENVGVEGFLGSKFPCVSAEIERGVDGTTWEGGPSGGFAGGQKTLNGLHGFLGEGDGADTNGLVNVHLSNGAKAGDGATSRPLNAQGLQVGFLDKRGAGGYAGVFSSCEARAAVQTLAGEEGTFGGRGRGSQVAPIRMTTEGDGTTSI